MKALTSKKVLGLVIVTVLLFTLFTFRYRNYVRKQHGIYNTIDTTKYILLWTSDLNDPFVYMGKGQRGFIDRKCHHTNCFVTGNKSQLDDITKFDVIAFYGPEVIRMTTDKLPKTRSHHQKYVFASIESSDYYPVCSDRFDNYFNWTWTYKLDSDIRWEYMVIKDKENNIVGPNKVMHWIKHEDMDPVNDEFKEQLKSKSNAAAWLVSNCHSKSKRKHFVKKLQRELKKYNLTVDVYGSCGPLKCSKVNKTGCSDLIKKKYYFYLSFENSFSEDYVTEKLLSAVLNDAVPIVYGSANYSRFIPDGAYLDARKMGAINLAATMNMLIQSLDDYAEYFRWKNHYSYHQKSDSVDTDVYCLFCSILNDKNRMQQQSICKNFRKWWNPLNRCQW